MGGGILSRLLAGGLDDFATSGTTKLRVGREMQPFKFDVSDSRFSHMPGYAENMRLARPQAEKYATKWGLGQVDNVRPDGSPTFIEDSGSRVSGSTPLTLEDALDFLRRLG